MSHLIKIFFFIMLALTLSALGVNFYYINDINDLVLMRDVYPLQVFDKNGDIIATEGSWHISISEYNQLSSRTKELIDNVLGGRFRASVLISEYYYNYKINVFFCALRLCLSFDKDKLYEVYLNNIEYSSNIFGIESAAYYFYNARVKDLSLDQIINLLLYVHGVDYKKIILDLKNTGFISSHEYCSILANYQSLVILNNKLDDNVLQYIISQVKGFLPRQSDNSFGIKVLTTLDMKVQPLLVSDFQSNFARRLMQKNYIAESGYIPLVENDLKSIQHVLRDSYSSWFNVDPYLIVFIGDNHLELMDADGLFFNLNKSSVLCKSLRVGSVVFYDNKLGFLCDIDLAKKKLGGFGWVMDMADGSVVSLFSSFDQSLKRKSFFLLNDFERFNDFKKFILKNSGADLEKIYCVEKLFSVMSNNLFDIISIYSLLCSGINFDYKSGLISGIESFDKDHIFGNIGSSAFKNIEIEDSLRGIDISWLRQNFDDFFWQNGCVISDDNGLMFLSCIGVIEN